MKQLSTFMQETAIRLSRFGNNRKKQHAFPSGTHALQHLTSLADKHKVKISGIAKAYPPMKIRYKTQRSYGAGITSMDSNQLVAISAKATTLSIIPNNILRSL